MFVNNVPLPYGQKNPNYTYSNLTSIYTDRSTDAVVRNQNLSSASDFILFFQKVYFQGLKLFDQDDAADGCLGTMHARTFFVFPLYFAAIITPLSQGSNS